MLETKLFAKPPKVYSLSTVPLFQKYTGVFGGVFARFSWGLKTVLKGLPFVNLFMSDLAAAPVFISGAEQYIRGAICDEAASVANGMVQVVERILLEVHVGE